MVTTARQPELCHPDNLGASLAAGMLREESEFFIAVDLKKLIGIPLDSIFGSNKFQLSIQLAAKMGVDGGWIIEQSLYHGGTYLMFRVYKKNKLSATEELLQSGTVEPDDKSRADYTDFL